MLRFFVRWILKMEESGFSVKKEVPPATASSFATKNTENALRNTEGERTDANFTESMKRQKNGSFPTSCEFGVENFHLVCLCVSVSLLYFQ